MRKILVIGFDGAVIDCGFGIDINSIDKTNVHAIVVNEEVVYQAEVKTNANSFKELAQAKINNEKEERRLFIENAKERFVNEFEMALIKHLQSLRKIENFKVVYRTHILDWVEEDEFEMLLDKIIDRNVFDVEYIGNNVETVITVTYKK